MSSILKALKKLEEEKSGRQSNPAESSGGQFIAPAASRSRSVLLLVCGIGAGLLLAGGLYALLGGRADMVPVEALVQKPVEQASPVIAPATTSVKPAAPAAPAAASAMAPVRSVDAVPVPPSRAGKAETVATGQKVRLKPGPGPIRPPVAKASPPARPVAGVPMRPVVQSAPKPPVAPIARPVAQGPAAPAARTTDSQASSVPVIPRHADNQPTAVPAGSSPSEVVEQVQVERSEIPAPGQQWSAPRLMVSDILPVSDRENMAIVNDLPVMVGTVVENAVVKEIRLDRVVFEINGRRVMVPLTSSR